MQIKVPKKNDKDYDNSATKLVVYNENNKFCSKKVIFYRKNTANTKFIQ